MSPFFFSQNSRKLCRIQCAFKKHKTNEDSQVQEAAAAPGESKFYPPKVVS